MKLVEDYFSKKYFSDEILPEFFEKQKFDLKILHFHRVFRRHHVANDPINWIDPDGLRKNFVFQGGNLSFYGDAGELLFEGSAVSGPWGNGALPKGSYSVGNMRDGRSGSFACGGNNGYSLDLESRSPINRNLLRIHPDGGTPGTKGCVGVSCQNGAADALGEILRGIYNQPMTPWIDLDVR